MPFTALADTQVRIELSHRIDETLQDELQLMNMLVNDDQLTPVVQEENRAASITLDAWRDISYQESKIATDQHLTYEPKKVTSFLEHAVGNARSETWGVMNLASQMSRLRLKPLEFITQQIVNYWKQDIHTCLISVLTGLLNHNLTAPIGQSTHELGDMITGDGTETINHKLLLLASSAYGDAINTTSLSMYVSMPIYLQMADQEHFIPANTLMNDPHYTLLRPSAQNVRFMGLYFGYAVYLDSRIPIDVVGGTAMTYLVGAESIAFKRVSPSNSIAYVIDEKDGNASGSKQIISREHYAIHPRGYSIDPNIAVTPRFNGVNFADYEKAAVWTRASKDRERIHVGFIKTKISL